MLDDNPSCIMPGANATVDVDCRVDAWCENLMQPKLASNTFWWLFLQRRRRFNKFDVQKKKKLSIDGRVGHVFIRGKNVHLLLPFIFIIDIDIRRTCEHSF